MGLEASGVGQDGRPSPPVDGRRMIRSGFGAVNRLERARLSR
jgi:hypothetical protein